VLLRVRHVALEQIIGSHRDGDLLALIDFDNIGSPSIFITETRIRRTAGIAEYGSKSFGTSLDLGPLQVLCRTKDKSDAQTGEHRHSGSVESLVIETGLVPESPSKNQTVAGVAVPSRQPLIGCSHSTSFDLTH
jgi:hypothetical protein